LISIVSQCCGTIHKGPDLNKVDLIVLPPFDFVPIGFQLKTVQAKSDQLSTASIRLRLDCDTYNFLRRLGGQPRYLAVMEMEENCTWVIERTHSIEIQYGLYFLSLAGRPPIETQDTTIHVPRSNRLTVEAMKNIMRDAIRDANVD
jgi:hypothetical protein